MKILISLLFLHLAVFSQTKGIVVDENKKPIPYVNIWVENENIGTTSEKNGTFEINTTDKNKILVFSAVGFETQKVKVSDCKIVILQFISYPLNEVVIENPQFDKEIEIGDSKKQNFQHWSGKTPSVLVKFFRFKNEY